MIEFRLLGSLDLRNAEGIEVRSVLAQPKRVALLAYLSVAGSGGFHRRDRLLALFWPELDAEHARGALRRSLYFLRQSLGEGVIVSRGDEEVGIAAGSLRCDAAECARLLEAGRHAQALELYRGDLLEGFFVADAPDFERWLETERAALRGQAASACWSLVEEAEAGGEIERAVHLARRAAALSGDDEPAVRRLIALLDRSGDAASALQVYDELVEHLAREYELEPAPETRALAEAVRVRRNEPVSAGSPAVRDRAEARIATLPRSPRRASRRSAITRRAPARLLLPLLGVALLGGAALVARRRSAPAPAAASNVVAVLPFSYYGSGESAYLREGIVRLLSANLNGAGDVRSIDPRALLGAVATSGVAPDKPGAARALAERLGAGAVVQGHIIESGGRLRITAMFSRAGSGMNEVTVEGEAARLLDLVDELTAKLLALQTPGPAARLIRLAARTTHSLPALRAYLEGEAQMQSGRYGDAFDSFRRSVAADSSFALAYYRLSHAAYWLNEPALLPATMHAYQLRGRLPRREALLVEAWADHLQGHPLSAERLYRSALTEYPDDVEAWLELGEVLFHWGPSVGRSLTAAREPFERVLAYEPANAGALIHLARIAAFEGDTARLARLVDRVQALAPGGDRELETTALGAFARGDAEEIERLAPRLSAAGAGVVLRVARAVAVFARDLTDATVLAGRVTASDKVPELRARAHLLLARFETARGRWHAARDQLAQLDRSPQQQRFLTGAEYRAAFAVLPFLAVPRAELEEIRDEVSRLPRYARFGDADVTEGPRRIYVPHQYYLRGLLSARLGDPVAALEEAMRLEAYAGSATDTAISRRLARVLRAAVAWSGGQAQDALRLLPEPGVWPDASLPHPRSYPQEYERFLYAELLRAVGRDEDALRWYASQDPQGYDLIYRAVTHLRRAQIHERRGERDAAVAQYRRFLALWRDADAALQPLVRSAHDALARLDRG